MLVVALEQVDIFLSLKLLAKLQSAIGGAKHQTAMKDGWVDGW
jgi:hypothetical protein